MEEALTYRNIAEVARDIILVMNLEGKILKANEAACDAYGYSRSEMLKMSIFDLRAPETAGQIYAQMAQANNEGIIFETKHIRQDGTVFPVEVNSRRVIIGNKALLFSTIRDISDRVDRESELLKLFTAVEQSPVSIVITDLQGKIEYVNPKFTQITGYTEEEARGQNPRILKSGEQPPEVYQKLWTDIAAGREWRGEFHNKRKNGELYWELASISPIRNAAGGITHYIAIKEDITARKETEAVLQRDLELAGKIQQGFLPKPFQSDYLEIATIFKPHHHVSGDVFDYVWNEQRKVMSGYIIDVMGHGIGTALQTAALRVLCHQAMEKNLSPKAKLAWINGKAMPYFAEDSFAAAIYFEFDFKRNILRYSAAGINYFLAASNSKRGVVSIPGLFLGITAKINYEEHVLAFASGSSFYFMSDGLFELLGADHDVCSMNYREAGEFLQLLTQSPQRHDDASALCIHIK